MRLFPSIDPPQPAIGRSRRRIRISFSAKSRGEFGIGLKRHSDLVDEDSPALGRCQEESATGKNRPDRSRRPAPAPMNLKTNRTSPLRLGIFLFLLLFSFPLAAQPPARASGTNSPRWASARVVFDVSSLEHIFLRPEDIFANAERFWKEDGAYRLANQNDDRFCSLLRPLQNEGMATYVAFKAVAMYPAAAEKDYQLLANPADVIDLRNKLNGFFERATSLPADELQKRSWDIGVMQRAYYIIGADMARTIEGKAGRRALIDTITKGPRSFVTTYNALVPAADRIVELR